MSYRRKGLMFYMIDQVNDRTRELQGAGERIHREHSLRAWLVGRFADAAARTGPADVGPPTTDARERCEDAPPLDGRPRPQAA